MKTVQCEYSDLRKHLKKAYAKAGDIKSLHRMDLQKARLDIQRAKTDNDHEALDSARTTARMAGNGMGTGKQHRRLLHLFRCFLRGRTYKACEGATRTRLEITRLPRIIASLGTGFDDLKFDAKLMVRFKSGVEVNVLPLFGEWADPVNCEKTITDLSKAPVHGLLLNAYRPLYV